MNKRSALIILTSGFLAAPLALAQCPAVEFESRSTITTDPGYVQGIALISPGSFAGVQIAPTPPFNLLKIAPHIERQLIGCYQKDALGTASPAFKDYSAGAASMPVNIGRLNGNWTIGGISLSTSGGASAVNVIAANPPLQVTTNTRYPLPGVPNTGLFVDLNHDGFADLVIVHSNPQTKAGGISILLGNGDGTFKDPVSYPAGTTAVSVCAGDFNGDGNIDLAVATQSGDSVILLIGNGTGAFSPGSSASLPSGFIPSSVTTADLNGDGKLDLVLTTTSGLYVLLGSGSGAFSVGPLIPLPDRVTFTAIGDFNLDGKPDLAVAFPSIGDSPTNSNVSVLLGKGDGTFATPTTYLGPNFTSYLVVTDMNGDGKPDIVVAQGTPSLFAADDASGKITTFLGNGDGTFQGSRLYSAGVDPVNIVSADVNGDGKPDLIVVDSVNSFGGSATNVVTPFYTFLNQGNGTFSAPIAGSSTTLGYTLTAADFNGDGKTDIAIAGANVSIQFGKGDGSFTAASPVPGVTSASFVTAGDFNGDGKPDLIIGTAAASFLTGPNGLGISLNNGNGTFAAPANLGGSTPIAITSANPATWIPVAVATGDFNRDGKLDIAVVDSGRGIFDRSQPGGVVVFLGKGNGTFQTGTELGAGLSPAGVVVGDLNGDGILDLAVTAGGGVADTTSGYEIAVLLGNGDGSFRAPVFFPTEFGPAGLSIADINGDAKPDLVVTHCCGKVKPTYLLGNGDGTFQPEVEFSVGTSPNATVVNDLNGDGKPDIAAVSHTGVAVLINRTIAPGVTSVSGAGFIDIPLTPNSIMTGFGADLASGTAQADALPLPTDLAGANFSIKDSTGATAPVPLFYASPSQVNYLVPGGVALGMAQLSAVVSHGTLTEAVQIVPFSPSLFVLSSNLVAGYLTRISNGVASTEQVFQSVGDGIVPRPIPLPVGSDQLTLTLFGTGLRAYEGTFYAMVGNQFAPVLYAGAQGNLLGLDQVNIQLPATLARGTLPLVVGTFTGGFSNSASILLQ